MWWLLRLRKAVSLVLCYTCYVSEQYIHHILELRVCMHAYVLNL